SRAAPWPGLDQPDMRALPPDSGATTISATNSAVTGSHTAQEKFDSSAHWAFRLDTYSGSVIPPSCSAGRSSIRSSARSARRYHAPALISIGSIRSPWHRVRGGFSDVRAQRTGGIDGLGA